MPVGYSQQKMFLVTPKGAAGFSYKREGFLLCYVAGVHRDEKRRSFICQLVIGLAWPNSFAMLIYCYVLGCQLRPACSGGVVSYGLLLTGLDQSHTNA